MAEPQFSCGRWNFMFWDFLEISTLHKNARINIFMVYRFARIGERNCFVARFKIIYGVWTSALILLGVKKSRRRTWVNFARPYLDGASLKGLATAIKPFLCPKGEGEFCPLTTKTSSVSLVNLLSARDFCVQIGPDFNLKSPKTSCLKSSSRQLAQRVSPHCGVAHN